jgi:hypothetical protein
MGASTSRWAGTLANVRKQGVVGVLIAAAVLPVAAWQGGRAALHHHSLAQGGIIQTATVRDRSFKHCYGFRCSDPVFFKGRIGSADYNRFSENCGKSCWWFIRYQFVWNSNTYIITEAVFPKVFEQSPLGSTVRINVDPSDPAQSLLVGSTKDQGLIFAFYVIVGIGVLLVAGTAGSYLGK